MTGNDSIYIMGIDHDGKAELKICCIKNKTTMTAYLRSILENIFIKIEEDPDHLPEVSFRRGGFE